MKSLVNPIYNKVISRKLFASFSKENRSTELLICLKFSSIPKNQFEIEEISIPNGPQYGYKIACKVWKGGSGEKKEVPIIACHGWLDNANTWDALLPKLMRPGRVVYAFDLPGHGLSSHIKTTHYNSHIESHLGIHRVARHLQLDKFTLLGHSMGAEAAVMYAATFPQNVNKLITIDGVNPKFPDWVQSTQLFVTSLLEIESLLERSSAQEPSTYEELLERIMKARKGMVTEEGCRILLERGSKNVPGSEGKYRFSHDLKLRMLPGMAMMTTDQMTQFCSEINAPLCVIKAAANDSFSNQASKDFQTAMESAKIQNKEMNIEFHVVDGNHHVHLNEPDKIVPIVSKFLDL